MLISHRLETDKRRAHEKIFRSEGCTSVVHIIKGPEKSNHACYPAKTTVTWSISQVWVRTPALRNLISYHIMKTKLEDHHDYPDSNAGKETVGVGEQLPLISPGDILIVTNSL